MANVSVTATPPCLAGGWQPRRVSTIIIFKLHVGVLTALVSKWSLWSLFWSIHQWAVYLRSKVWCQGIDRGQHGWCRPYLRPLQDQRLSAKIQKGLYFPKRSQAVCILESPLRHIRARRNQLSWLFYLYGRWSLPLNIHSCKMWRCLASSRWYRQCYFTDWAWH